MARPHDVFVLAAFVTLAALPLSGCGSGGSGAPSGTAGTSASVAISATSAAVATPGNTGATAVTASPGATGAPGSGAGLPWTRTPDAASAPARPIQADLNGHVVALPNVKVFHKDKSWFLSFSEPESVDSDRRQRVYFTTDKALAPGKLASEGFTDTCYTSIARRPGDSTRDVQYQGAWSLEITEWKLDKPLAQAPKNETIGHVKGRIVMMCSYGDDRAAVAGTFEAPLSQY